MSWCEDTSMRIISSEDKWVFWRGGNSKRWRWHWEQVMSTRSGNKVQKRK